MNFAATIIISLILLIESFLLFSLWPAPLDDCECLRGLHPLERLAARESRDNGRRVPAEARRDVGMGATVDGGKEGLDHLAQRVIVAREAQRPLVALRGDLMGWKFFN
jgi:hypothetical protein